MRRRLAAAAAGLLVVLTACTEADSDARPADSSGTGVSRVDVDTPELREAKAVIGVEECAPGRVDDGGLPAVTLACFGGGPAVDLATLEGPLVLNFWQAACGPCREEMPALQEFHEQHGHEVPVIGIDFLDVAPDAAMELVEETGATYPLLADPGGELQATELRPRGLPTFVFLAADGEVTMTAGGVESSDELVDLVREHLGVDL